MVGRILFAFVLCAAVSLAETKPVAGGPGQPAPAPQTKPAVQTPAQQFSASQAAQATSQTAAADKAPAPAATPSAGPPNQKPDADAVKSAMEQSLANQRKAVMLQVASVMGKAPTPAASFFTVPWVQTPVPFNAPPCDPMPETELSKIVLEKAQQEGVKPELIRAVIQQESAARPCAVSWKGAQGLMQLMPATADQFGVTDPFDPQQNVEAGTKLLKQLLAKYNNDVNLALAAYNAGEGRVDKDGGVPQIPETMNYVNDIQSKLGNK